MKINKGEEMNSRKFRKNEKEETIFVFPVQFPNVGCKEGREEINRLIPSNAPNRITIENDTSNLCVSARAYVCV